MKPRALPADQEELARENERLAGELNLLRSLVFASGAMSRLSRAVYRVAARDVPVLVCGERGTGKERVAEAIVRASARAKGPHLRVSAASLPDAITDAELFGAEAGASPDVREARRGLLREAHGGTLFLEDISELPLATQGSLLRLLEEGEVLPLGADHPEKVNVRLIASTHRDLAREVERGAFHEALYRHFEAVTLSVPPLRERPEDVPVLVGHFLTHYGKRFGFGEVRVPDGIMERLRAYDWPGNVHELELFVENALALSQDGTFDEASLPPLTPRETRGVPLRRTATLKQRTQAYERGIILDALRESRGNRTRAARMLGVSRATLHEKLRKHRIGAERDLWASGTRCLGEAPPVPAGGVPTP